MLSRVDLDAEDGSAYVATVLGVMALLTFLLLTVQISAVIYSSSVAQGAAYDAADALADASCVNETTARGIANDIVKQRLGQAFDRTTTASTIAPDHVRVEITVTGGLDAAPGFAPTSATAVGIARRECLT